MELHFIRCLKELGKKGLVLSYGPVIIARVGVPGDPPVYLSIEEPHHWRMSEISGTANVLTSSPPRESNPRPAGYKPAALPTEPDGRVVSVWAFTVLDLPDLRHHGWAGNRTRDWEFPGLALVRPPAHHRRIPQSSPSFRYTTPPR